MKFSFFITSMLAALSASAMQSSFPSVPKVVEVGGEKMVAIELPAAALGVAADGSRAGEEYTPWGYCGDDIKVQIGFSSYSETIKAAIVLTPDMLGPYRNARIMGMRVGISSEASNLSAFLIERPAGNELGVEDFDAVPIRSANLSGTQNIGWKDMIFRVPYQLKEETLLIAGYSATGVCFLGYDGFKANMNGSYICRNGQWGSIYKYLESNGFGTVCIQLLLGGDGMPDNEMAIGDIITKHVEQNRPAVIKGIAINKTTKTPVHNYEVTCELSDGSSYSSTINHIVGINAADTFAIEIPPLTKTGVTPMQLSISKVNGLDDSFPDNNTRVALVDVIEEGCYFPRMVVAEEATSILCGFCPNGILVMESMSSRYPDTFIGIAVHSNDMGNDPMTDPNYEMVQNYFSGNGLPNGIINRKSELSGMPVYFEKYYDSEAGKLSLAGIGIVASKPADGKIKLTTDVTFNTDMSNGSRYLLSYVLLEDSVRGYSQLNYYAGGAYGAMGGWENLPSAVDIDFNMVARGIWDLNGIIGSIPRNIVKKQPVRHEYEITLPKTVQNTNNLRVVAMLLDGANDCEIVQAAVTKPGASSKIDFVASDSADSTPFTVDGAIVLHGDDPVEVYSLQGVRMANGSLAPGLYIARSSSHSAKVLIR